MFIGSARRQKRNKDILVTSEAGISYDYLVDTMSKKPETRKDRADKIVAKIGKYVEKINKQDTLEDVNRMASQIMSFIRSSGDEMGEYEARVLWKFLHYVEGEYGVKMFDDFVVDGSLLNEVIDELIETKYVE